MDERVREALVDLADEVRPAPDPYGRLRVRRARARRRRVVAAGLALAAVVAATVPLGDRGGPGITDSDANRMRTITEWAERSRTSPVRGAFGAREPGYVAELTALVGARQRAGAYDLKAPVTEVNVLYLDDIGDVRVAFVAFHLADPDPVSLWTNASGWFVARAGASAADLAEPGATSGIGDGLEPFETVSQLSDGSGDVATDATIGVAPAGCVIESAPLPDLDTWTPEPGGNLLVRTAASERREWWRVVCAGVVKDERPARAALRYEPVTEAEVDEALRDARGRVPRKLAREAVENDRREHYSTGVGPTRVLWGGKIEGARPDHHGPWNGNAIVTATPVVRGGWDVTVTVHTSPDGSAPGGGGFGVWVSDNPNAADAVLPVRLLDSVSVLVVVPKPAVTVRAVRDGSVLASVPVVDQAAVVDAPAGPGLTFEALDKDGTVLDVARLPQGPPADTDVVPW
ncbi:hypothetical protein Asi02nite_45070 [Asanoa siamensis]|uniref:Uncharacterized protein n=1 Tax=Asanoa siamensis TaxID=926357 RepID=A0ABQ4CUN3_9ACTN|nr:hypothetical protein Asi02nite_45070 [Asanoa siamensis]